MNWEMFFGLIRKCCSYFRKPTAEREEEDEFSNEIQFDPTISSGEMGFVGEAGLPSCNDFRNTPIKLLGNRLHPTQT